MGTLLTTNVPAKIRAAVAACEFAADFFVTGESLLFDHGHMVEVSGKLARKNQKKQKYPLVILVEDFDHDIYAGMMHLNLRLFIVNYNSDLVMDSPARWQGVVTNRLLPMYEEFMKQISANGFSWDKTETPGTRPPHTMTVRTKFGVWLKEFGEGNGTFKKVFNDPLDAIEINDLKINCKALTCYDEVV